MREHAHELARVGDDALGERVQPAVLQVDDAVGDVEDAVVVGDEQHRAALLARERPHQLDDVAARLLVERRGRLVGEHELRLGDERARDGDALLLPARHLVRVVAASATRGRRP